MTEKKTTKKEANPVVAPVEADVNIGEFISQLNMEELDFVESVSGMSLDELEIPGRAKGRFIAGVALVAKRRTDDKFTWSQATKLNMNEVKAILKEASTAKKAPATNLEATSD